MPWTLKDAIKHTKKATTITAKKQWADVANSELKRTGDEGLAIRAANRVIRDRSPKKVEKKR